MPTPFVQFGLDDGAGETRDGLHLQMRRHLNRAAKYRAREIRLIRGERVLIERADGRDTDVARPGLGCELLGKRLPVRVVRSRGTVVEPDPFDGAKTQASRAFQLLHFPACKHSDSHSPENEPGQSTLRLRGCRGKTGKRTKVRAP